MTSVTPGSAGKAAVITATATPVSFMDALKQRYGATDDGDATGSTLAQDKKWQFVGAEKTANRQSQYDRLTLVVLRDCGMTCAFKSNETSECNAVKDANMVRLEELDISGNTALTLNEIGKLLPFFPRLSTLQVCDIPSLLLAPSEQNTASASSASFPNPAVHAASPPLLMSAQLSKLVLNNTGFTSLAQLRALIAVPTLKELHLDSNNLMSLEVTLKTEADGVAAAGAASAITFPHVTTLSLAHNALSDWAAIGAAITQTFPALTQLFLTDNKLNDLSLSEKLIAHVAATTGAGSNDGGGGENTVAWTPEEEEELKPYRFLQPLTLLCLKDNTTLVNPATVDAIRILCPHLTTFRITYSSLLPTWNETNSRMYVVAALPTITLLNRGTVRPKERLDSELLYIQRGLQQRAREAEEASAERATPGEAQQPLTTRFTRIPYPLVDVLKEKHKEVVLSIQREGDTATTTGANYLMLDVTIYFVNGYAATSTTADSTPFSKQTQRLPSSLMIAKLKALVQKLFQVKPVNQKLSYSSGDDGVLETQTWLENEQETLGYYGVPNGAVIYVEDTSLRVENDNGRKPP